MPSIYYCCWVASVVSDSVRPIDSNPPGSPVPGILQERTLEWVAISFSNAWKWKVRVKSLSHVRLFTTPWTVAYQAPPSMGFSRQEYQSGVPLPSPLAHTRYFQNCWINEWMGASNLKRYSPVFPPTNDPSPSGLQASHLSFPPFISLGHLGAFTGVGSLYPHLPPPSWCPAHFITQRK